MGAHRRNRPEGPTGWAEWSEAGPRDQRVGLVHAVTNALAISTYAASWISRQRGRHGTGVQLALAGAAVLGAGAYLGGHLAAARKVSSRHPAYVAERVHDHGSQSLGGRALDGFVGLVRCWHEARNELDECNHCHEFDQRLSHDGEWC